MKTSEFLRQHGACRDGAKWALSVSDDMADVWDALIENSNHSWLLWTATRQVVFPDAALRKLACRFVRETPLMDGRVVWDLLTDERSRRAVGVAEAYSDGKATYDDLKLAGAAASDAADAAYFAARAAASDAAYAASRAARAAAYSAARATADDADAAAYAAADAAAYANQSAAGVAHAASDAAKDAQVQMIAELGNPFKKGTHK